MMPVESRGRVMELQHYAVHDGEGIRTLIFLSGCPLRCVWCANPESQSGLSSIAYDKDKCIGCFSCTAVCPEGIGSDLADPAARARCTSCGACAQVCPTAARKTFAHWMDADAVLAAIDRQKIFYRQSGGGVTFSGGEPTVQQGFLRTLAGALYDRGVDLAMETTAFFDYGQVRDILEKMDLVFVDLKHMDPAEHLRFTGVDNALILRNLIRLGEDGMNVIVRVPVIGGVNATAENLGATARFVKRHLPDPRMELLPYHRFGEDKYRLLGRALPPAHFSTPDDRQIAELEAVARAEGVRIVRYR